MKHAMQLSDREKMALKLMLESTAYAVDAGNLDHVVKLLTQLTSLAKASLEEKRPNS